MFIVLWEDWDVLFSIRNNKVGWSDLVVTGGEPIWISKYWKCFEVPVSKKYLN